MEQGRRWRAGKRTYVQFCSLAVWITGICLRPIPHREHANLLVYLPSEPTSKYPAKTFVLLRLPYQLIVITLLGWETGSFSQVPPAMAESLRQAGHVVRSVSQSAGKALSLAITPGSRRVPGVRVGWRRGSSLLPQRCTTALERQRER
jgi:hypothetical protein